MAASQSISSTAGRALAARVRATGAKASVAASGLVESDGQSAQRLAGVGPGSAAVVH